MIYSRKIQALAPSVTLVVTAKAEKLKEEGADVISFGAGEPDFNTPENIKEAAIQAIVKGYTKYTATTGIKELKKAIVNKFKTDNNLMYDPSQVIVSTGAKQCLSNIFQAILNPCDEVIISLPCWVSYPELIKMYDGVPVLIPTDENNKFKYTQELLDNAITSKTKAIIVTSPNNPTGTVYNKEELLMIAEFAKKNDLIIISDEIYEKLIYDDNKHISIAGLSEDAYNRTIVVNGVSKSYAMTGWRMGYAAGNQAVIEIMANIQSHTTSNPSSITQYAALEALAGDQVTVHNMIKEFKKRRDYMVGKINSIRNVSCIKPDGAFYVMMNISKLLDKKVNGKLIKSSIDFAELLLENEKVAVVPGAGFGDDNYVRLSYATSMDKIERGLSKVEKFIYSIEL